jgi:hypothetical protein
VRYLIAHAPWAPGRKAALSRLGEYLPEEDTEVIASRGPEHAAIWSRRIWERAARFDGHVCLLNDDVRPVLDFTERVERAIAAQPDEPISLHCSNPNVAPIKGAWARCYHYSGPGVIFPPGAAADLLAFVYGLPWAVLSRLNEDNVANAWAWDRQRPFWYLLPSPLTHDTTVPSTLGYDDHPHRNPVLIGEERDPTITDKNTVPFVELEWGDTRALNYRRHVLRAGRMLCSICLGRESIIGGAAVSLCDVCLADLAGAAIKRP